MQPIPSVQRHSLTSHSFPSRWEFIRASNGKWSWKATSTDGKIFAQADTFFSLDLATASATTQGFDPFLQHWMTTFDGRTTHFRPGKNPINVTVGEAPAD